VTEWERHCSTSIASPLPRTSSRPPYASSLAASSSESASCRSRLFFPLKEPSMPGRYPLHHRPRSHLLFPLTSYHISGSRALVLLLDSPSLEQWELIPQQQHLGTPASRNPPKTNTPFPIPSQEQTPHPSSPNR